MSDNSKPFEIRSGLLHLAKDILSENMHMKREFLERTGQSGQASPVQYTTDEVIAEAEKLYGFVTKKQ